MANEYITLYYNYYNKYKNNYDLLLNNITKNVSLINKIKLSFNDLNTNSNSNNNSIYTQCNIYRKIYIISEDDLFNDDFYILNYLRKYHRMLSPRQECDIILNEYNYTKLLLHNKLISAYMKIKESENDKYRLFFEENFNYYNNSIGFKAAYLYRKLNKKKLYLEGDALTQQDISLIKE